MFPILRLFKIALLVTLVHAGNAQAQHRSPIVNRTAFSQSYTTRHELDLPGRKIKFTATAENLVFTEPRGFPRAEITYVAYTKDGSDPATRPVAFIVNGGPGASSAYLNLLAIGPWRTSLGGARTSTSLSTLQPNAETWLDFTDLVFIDPPGTGYSRVTGGERLRQHYHSVGGDIDGLASFIHRWMIERERQNSPIYFVGASYGGFRAPLLARKIQKERPKGFSGLILISPALDFDLLPFGRAIRHPWVSASILPSLAAIWAERNSSFTPELLQEAETYASGEYISDLLRGVDDTPVIDRIAQKVGKLTGIAPEATRLSKGQVDIQAFLRDLGRWPAPNLGSYNVYEARRTVEYSEDHDLEYLTRIISGEMDVYFKNMMKFQTSEKYKVIDLELNRAWIWNNGRYGVESLSSLEQALNADRGMRVLIAHGTSDLTTPYFATKMLAAQIEVRETSRLDFKLYGGNHLFYTREVSRRAFRDDARVFFQHGQDAQTPSHR
ncbi:serine aminopeptidase domain-containing protein [Microvirga sp. VF16]|uniref:S10 family serine carboxypeptidase-like protein n=1 Tax=Microvirga sp. VF16 TaxID=2807101 RepID=UPI00193C8A41|nr:alpha/beta hydrolase [Microvirga sp. VF16]QRM27967.1 alpha/beta hydrolase [Microvirga sp. VF16]